MLQQAYGNELGEAFWVAFTFQMGQDVPGG